MQQAVNGRQRKITATIAIESSSESKQIKNATNQSTQKQNRKISSERKKCAMASSEGHCQ